MKTEIDGLNAYFQILRYYPGLQSDQIVPQTLFWPGERGYLADLLFCILNYTNTQLSYTVYSIIHSHYVLCKNIGEVGATPKLFF